MFGIALGGLEPGDEIAAYLRRKLLACAAPDFRGTQRTRCVQFDAARAQLGQQRGVDEIVDHAEAALGQLVDQARRRERSARRFASGLRLLRVFAGVRRGFFAFVSFFLGGHNMVPRHCGEPQRQA